MLFVREFRPIDSQQSSFHLFHLSTEERLQNGGDSAFGLWLAVVFCGWVVFVLFSTRSPSDCISLPSMMIWAPCPHGVRTRGKKERAKAIVKESPTSWLLPICYDQPLRLRRSINRMTIDEVMQDRTTRQVWPFSQASNFRLGQVCQSS